MIVPIDRIVQDDERIITNRKGADVTRRQRDTPIRRFHHVDANIWDPTFLLAAKVTPAVRGPAGEPPVEACGQRAVIAPAGTGRQVPPLG